jgi:hypothetical protein
MAEKKHDHGACSNKTDSIITFIGCKVSGVLTNVHRGGVTIVFACGWGLTFNSNGAYWTEGPDKIQSAREELREDLARAGR